MLKNYRLLILFFLIPLLSSCTGTGSKIKPTISTTSDGKTTIYFSRVGGFVAGGVLAKVLINNSEIAICR